MSNYSFLLAGFGGQGILFTGKVIAYAGMMDGKEVSWLPSYGPEMRGGTANCSVTVSDEPIGSPLVVKPSVLVALNLPSLDKFEARLESGGKVIIDSSIIDRKLNRADVEAYYIPATRLASDNNLKGLANMIVLGKLLKLTGFVDDQTFKAALKKCIPAKKEAMLESNLRAIEIGFSY
jgi:2-oxoglutarate ferredoxin oxidoreductase subunit gamma